MSKHGERCETCCYWSTKGMPSCHKRAPRLMEAPFPGFMPQVESIEVSKLTPPSLSVWPPARPEEWCGDWEALAQKEEEIAGLRTAAQELYDNRHEDLGRNPYATSYLWERLRKALEGP